MKKITLTFVAVLSAILVLAQSPQAFKYQAVVRNNSGEILQNESVSFRISILDSEDNIIYQETHPVSTNQFGLAALEIGNGSPTVGSFPLIDWATGPMFLQIEIDLINGGFGYEIIGISQLMSVPYALYAKSSENVVWDITGDDIYYNNGNVGIGKTSPTEKLDVDGNISLSGELMPDGVSGAAGQVLQSTGNGNMEWAEASASQGTVGYGTWGDCEMQNIMEYNPVGDPDGEAGDSFGYAVAISSDFAIVGAPNDSDAGGNQQGSVIMFHRDQSTGNWVQDGNKLFNPGAYTEDHFGWSVDIDNNYAIIGTPYDFAATWDWGSASIIHRNETSGVWEFQGSKLVNQDPAVGDEFGYSVSISGDYAIVGAPGDDIGMGSNLHGSASVFKRNPSTGNWDLQGSKLMDSDPYPIDQFGYAVSISGDYAIVGTPHDYQSGNLGSASIFKRNPSTQVWEFQPPKLWNQDATAGDWFGSSVDISGDYAIVGAQGDEEGAGNLQGSVTLFRRDTITGEWKMVGAKLLNVNAAADQRFGWHVSLSGDHAIVSAIQEFGEYGAYQGSATIFMRVGSLWYRLQKIFDPAGNANDFFGTSCDIDGNTQRFVIGGPGANGSYGKVVFGKY